MRKSWITALIVMMVVALLCTGALAQGNQQGGGQPQGNGPQQGGGQTPSGDGAQPGQMGGGTMGGMLNTDEITAAIAALEDADTAASLTALLEDYQTAATGTDIDVMMKAMQALQEALSAAGIQVQRFGDAPMAGDGAPGNGGIPGNGGMASAQYGRFLDTEKVAAAIAQLTDEETIASLTALLQTYQTAVRNQEQTAIQEALQALLTAMNQAQTQGQQQTQTQNQMNPQAMTADEYRYLDTDAVAAAIAALTDTDTAASLTERLQAYTVSLITDDAQAIQSAFASLMSALTDAGIEV